MEWIEALQDELEDETLDFSTPATILQGLFQHSIYPNLLIDSHGRLGLPHLMSVRVGGSKAVASLLSHPKVFFGLPILLQKIVLDVLIFSFARKPYNIVRMQYNDDFHTTARESCSMNRHILKLLEESLSNNDSSVSKRLLLLLGYSASIGISFHELRKFLSFLKVPSELSLSLAQTLQLMLQPDDGVTKACPQSIFNFSGPGSGIIINKVAFPFPKEYQACFWFRIETFEEDFSTADPPSTKAFNTEINRIQHILTWANGGRKGLDIFIEKAQLMVAVSHTSKAEPIIMKVSNGSLKKGVWYHLCFRHSKPKMTFFSKDEFEVFLDDELVISESIRYPNLGNSVDVDFVIGHNFDGQMGPIYFFNESVPISVIQSIARVDAGRGDFASMEPTAADLVRSIVGPDRRPFPIASKLATCFHPTRCSNGRCIDIYGGNHGYLAKRTFPWNFHNPRDALSSIGGVLCLLPLFPRLLIENENIEKYAGLYDSTWGIGLGTCLAEFSDENEQLDSIYDRQTLLRINSWKEDFYGYGAISCLLSIVRNAIYNSRQFQEQLLVSGGIEMIESALQCVSPQLIIEEGEKCVFSLIHLKEAAVFSEPLQLKIAKLLLSNTSLWASSGSYQFLNSLLSVVLALIKAEPATSAAIVEFQNLLDTMGLFENLKEENIVRSRINSIAASHSNSANTSSMPSPVLKVETKVTTGALKTSNSDPELQGGLKESTPPPAPITLDINSPIEISTPDMSPRLHQPLSFGGSEAATTPSVRIQTANSPMGRAPKVPRTSNPNQALIASLRKMKSFKLALSETLQDELEEEGSPSSGSDKGNDLEGGVLEGIQEGEEDDLTEEDHQSRNIIDSSDSSMINQKALSLETPMSSQISDDSLFDSYISPYSSLEKKKLREYLGCVVAMLLKNNPIEADVVHIVDFIATCKDAVVLVELIQVLIFLMDQRCSPAITSNLVTAFGGIEEFVSFVIVYLVHQPNEDLRCAGIRLLAFFTMNIEQLSPQVATLSTRRVTKRNTGKVNGDGMSKLHACGALALLCEVVSSHCPVSTNQTYRSMLDLMLLKHGPLLQSVPSYETPSALRAQLGRGLNNPLIFDSDHMDDDDDDDVVNPLVLPIFLELLPKFPLTIHDQIYGDILSLIKRSPAIRNAFSSCPSWHLCMFSMVLELINELEFAPPAFKKVHLDDLTEELQQKAPSTISSSPLIQSRPRSNTGSQHKKNIASGGKLEVELLRRWKNNIPQSNNRNSASLALKYSNHVTSPDLRNLSNIDMNYDLGMKIYSTLLMHALEKRGGWRQLDQTISPSFESQNGYLIAQSILSHVMNDLTFNLKSRHKELQKLLKSNSNQDQQTAFLKMENLLSTILTASQIALIDQNCVMSTIPYPDVCKQRVHIFQEMQQHVRTASSSPMDTAGNLPTPRSVDSDRFQSLTLTEQRKFLDDIEKMLQESYWGTYDPSVLLEEYKGSTSVSPRPSRTTQMKTEGEQKKHAPDHSDGIASTETATIEEFLDLGHTWVDMNVLAVSARFSMPSQLRGHENGSSMSSLLDKPLEELLHPLERQHDEKSGKLILILQALRIFDTLFWPGADNEFQDSKMMLFSKEGAHFLKSTDANTKVGSTYMTIHSALMRMSLYALNNISPTNAISVMTLRRMRKAITCIDNLLPEASLAVDWMTASVTHVTLHLQRLAPVLDPIFALIGITDHDFRLRTFGPWEESKIPGEEFEDALKGTEEISIVHALDNEELLRVIEDYFDNSTGLNLLRNIRSSLRVLIDALHFHSTRLAMTLEERCYRSLTSLVETIKNDLYNAVVAILGDDGDHNSTPSKANNASPFPSRSSDNSQGGNSLSSVSTSPMVAPANSSSMSFSAPFRSRTFSTDPDADANYKNSSDNNNYNQDKPRNVSMSTNLSLPLSNLGGNGRQVSTASSTMPSSLNKEPKLPALSPEQAEYLENNFEGASIVLMLKWLLHPFFSKNILRSVEVIKVLEKLDNIEAKAVAKFSIETRILKDNLEEHRDVAIKSVAEMAELKSLSREVHDKIIERSKSKRHQLESQNLLKTKNVAARWHDCIQRFEDDWSPWTTSTGSDGNSVLLESSSGSGRETSGISYYELSKHRDCKLRNMLLTKLPEAIDHRDHAYLESKLKDQFSYIALQQQQDVSSTVTVGMPAGGPSNKVNLPVKFTPLAFAANSQRNQSQSQQTQSHNDWADLEDDDGGADNTAEDGGKTSTFTAGDLINPLGFFTSQEKRPVWTYMFSWATDERVLLIMDANQIQLDQVISGSVLLSNKCLYFHCKKRLGGLARAAKPFVDRKYQLDRLFEAYGRRYLLQNSAVELFFADSPELFLAFKSSKELQKFFRVLKNQTLPLLSTPLYLNPAKLFRASAYTEMWRRRMISNFEYLLRLNILAGRSYNDITQYPVFPWVISDYTSSSLDLTQPNVFRPLDKPIGAINPARLKEFLERYRTFDDDQVPKFMYGSHYSSAGVVLHYMIRQEPFTTLAVNLQGGRFDCPDRIFFDINRTWLGCNNSMSDVKELIPELYCCPDILINSSRVPLGELQEGGVVDDVILPPWAKNAFDFIRINREALESEYVSEHLHEWIDLIFGYKQKGPAAVKANNVFYYLTYENAIDIEAIDDQLQKEAAKAQVTHFGQTPSQLLNKEHPKRLPKSDCMLPLCHSTANIRDLQLFTPAGSAKQAGRHQQFGAVIAMQCAGERLIVMHENLNVCFYRWIASMDIDGSPFTLRPERVKVLPSASLNYSETLLKGIHAVDLNEVKSIAPFSTATSGIYEDNARERRPSGNFLGQNNRLSLSNMDEGDNNNNINSNNSVNESRDEDIIPNDGIASVENTTRGSNTATNATAPRPTSLLGRLSSFRFGANNSTNNSTVANGNGSNPAASEAPTAEITTATEDTSTETLISTSSKSSLRRSTSLYGAAIAAGQSLSSSIRGNSSNANAMVVEGTSTKTPPQKYFGKLVQSQSSSSHNLHTLTSYNHGNMHHNSIHRDDGASSAGTWTPLLTMTHHQVAIPPSGNRILTCGYWDHAVKMHALDSSLKEVSSVSGGHRGVITTLEVGSDGQMLLSGGMDGCLRVWVVDKPSLAQALSPEPFFSDYSSSLALDAAGNVSVTNPANGSYNSDKANGNEKTGSGGASLMLSSSTMTSATALAQANAPLICLHTMPGHSSPVTAVSYSADLDIVFSGDSEGLLCVHSVRQGNFLRAMKHMVGSSIDAVLAMTPGYLVAHSASSLTLSVSWVNGQVLEQITVDDRIDCMVCSHSSAAAMVSSVFVCGTQSGDIVFRDAANLLPLHKLTLEHGGGIRYLGFSEDEQFMLIGCRDGSYSIATDPETRKKLSTTALQKTPLLG